LIPNNTLAKVRLVIRPGGYDDPNQGWTDGMATCSESGAVYLDCEFVVMEGPWAKRKIWSLIGLHSPKGDGWKNMGRGFIKAMINSAFGLDPEDNSQLAQQRRAIPSLKSLDGLEFLAVINMERDERFGEKNVIKQAVTKEHKDYAKLMGQAAQPAQPMSQQPMAVTNPWG